MIRTRNRQNLRLPAVIAAAVALLVGAAACSSGSGGDSPASSQSSSTSPEVAAAQKAALAAEKLPQKIKLTPLKSRPPTGKTVVFLNPGNVQSHYDGVGIQAAASALQWKYRQIAIDQSTPSSIISGLNQALQYHPAAVVIIGVPESIWSSVLPAYKKAGVPIVALFDVTPISGPVIANVEAGTYFKQVGQILANWFIADSKGKGNVLIARLDQLTILQDLADTFTADVKQKCPGCSVTSVNQTLAQAESSTGNTTLTSALRSHPEDNYLMLTSAGLFSGITSALATAGLSNVKVFSAGAVASDLTAIKQGTESASIPASLEYGGWLAVDAALRHMQGLSTTEDGGLLPMQLLTKNVSFAISNSYNEPANFPAQMKQLWKISNG